VQAASHPNRPKDRPHERQPERRWHLRVHGKHSQRHCDVEDCGGDDDESHGGLVLHAKVIRDLSKPNGIGESEAKDRPQTKHDRNECHRPLPRSC